MIVIRAGGFEVDRLEDADFLEYWFLQFQLAELQKKNCSKCRNYGSCWSHEGAVYHPENVLKLCRNKQIRFIIEELNKKDSLEYAATAEEIHKLKSKLKLGLWKKLKLKIKGCAFVAYAKRKGWKGKLPFYIVKCKKHNINFLDYPHGYTNHYDCPICLKETLEARTHTTS